MRMTVLICDLKAQPRRTKLITLNASIELRQIDLKAIISCRGGVQLLSFLWRELEDVGNKVCPLRGGCFLPIYDLVGVGLRASGGRG